MFSIRHWLAHSSLTSSGQLMYRATIATSLFLIGCGSSPNFENAVTGQTGTAGATSLSINMPAGETGNEDLLIAVLGIQANPNTSGPDGWTGLPGLTGFNGATCQGDGQGTACQLVVFYRIGDGPETSVSFNWGGTRRAAGAVLRFSNVDTNAPFGATRVQRNSSDEPQAPQVTTSRDGSRVLRIVTAELDEARTFLPEALALTDPPPTARVNLISFPDALADPTNGCGPPLSACDATEDAVALAVSDTRHRTAGAARPVSWELNGADQWIAASLEIKRGSG